MLAQAAFLLALVAEQLRDGEPLDGFFVGTFVRRNHARQRGCHFRPKRNSALALVGEIVELADDLVAALGGEELERFEWRAIVFAKAVTPCGGTPAVEDVLARIGAPHVAVRERFGIEIAKAGQSIHRPSKAEAQNSMCKAQKDARQTMIGAPSSRSARRRCISSS